MRTIIAAILIATGVGLIGASRGSAAPVDAAALDRAAAASPVLLRTGYVRWHSRTCYAKCYYDFFVGHRVCRRFC